MAQPYAVPDVLVSTEWVAKHVGDPTFRLVEVDVDTSAYEQGHIRGAVAFNWQTQLQDQVRRDVVGREDLETLLGSLGISNSTPVVLYGDNNNWFAAYAFWLLKQYGHKEVRLMNGGRKKWVAEGRELTKEIPRYAPTTYVASDPNPSIRALRDFILEGLGHGERPLFMQESLARHGLALVDVRSPQEYTGEVIAPPGMTETAQRGGHIPGAVNIPWSQAVNENGTFKAVEELKALYEPKGVTRDKEVVAYCRIGERSSHTWFVLKYLLGYPKVRNYDGSWTEWGSIINVPIER